MKQKRIVLVLGALIIMISAVALITGCPTGQEPQKQQEDKWKPGEKLFLILHTI